MSKEKLKKLLMTPDVSFPADESELIADLTLAFTYGLSTGVFKPEYSKRLIRSLALEQYWFMDLIGKMAGFSRSPKDIAERELADFEDMADRVEKALPLD